jgi:DNA-binding transcriptional regulator YdaS (Cro superfamily)
VIEPGYLHADSFVDGLAIVGSEDAWGAARFGVSTTAVGLRSVAAVPLAARGAAVIVEARGAAVALRGATDWTEELVLRAGATTTPIARVLQEAWIV